MFPYGRLPGVRSSVSRRRHGGRAIVVFATIVCIAPRARGQGIWVDLNPNGSNRVTTAHLQDVDFFDASRGVVVGENGTILATIDRGDSWTSGNGETNVTLHGVRMLDASNAIAVGGAGVILHSTDGGLTWTPRTSGTSSSLSGVHFADAMTGAAVGSSGTILRSTDGGVTWAPQDSGVDIALFAVFLVDTQLGCAVGDEGLILRTTDGGASWQVIGGTKVCTSADHGIAHCNRFHDVYFHDASSGFAVGWPADPVYLAGGSVFKTNNGGTNWFKPYPPDEFEFLEAISFGSSTQGMILTSGFPAYHTEDAGATWTHAALPALPGTLHGLSHGDAYTAYAVGDNGTIARWETIATPVEKRTWGSVKSMFRK